MVNAGKVVGSWSNSNDKASKVRNVQRVVFATSVEGARYRYRVYESNGGGGGRGTGCRDGLDLLTTGLEAAKENAEARRAQKEARDLAELASREAKAAAEAVKDAAARCARDAAEAVVREALEARVRDMFCCGSEFRVYASQDTSGKPNKTGTCCARLRRPRRPR